MIMSISLEKLKVKVGDKIGNVTVIEYAGEFVQSGHKRHRFKVKCDCGEVYIKSGQAILHNGNMCMKCKGRHSRIFQNGERVDSLVIVELVYLKLNRATYKCQCDCGNVVFKKPSQLINNVKNNCGKCKIKFSGKGFNELSGTFFYRIKRNAEKRGLPFEISPQDIWDLFEKQKRRCALSDLEIEFHVRSKEPSTASLDRIDSKKGYTIDNVQWVHKDINTIKWDLSQEDFIKYCKLVTNKFK